MGIEGSLSKELSERATGMMRPHLIATLGAAIRIGRQQGLTIGEIRQSILLLELDILGGQQTADLAEELQVSPGVIRRLAARVCKKLLDDMLPEEPV